jgi:hypothetical protein
MTDSLKEYFIRPHRQTYYPFDLGPSTFFISGQRCLREDFQIYNFSDHKLMVSFYRIEDSLT